MKKNNYIIEILLKSIKGIFVGNTLLLISYIGIYWIGGEITFINEISQLQNVKTLITQSIFNGICYYLFFILLNISIHMQNKEVKNHVSISISFVIVTCISVFDEFILASTRIYSKNIAMLNVIILVVIFLAAGFLIGIKDIIDRRTVKNINQKLKEKSLKND